MIEQIKPLNSSNLSDHISKVRCDQYYQWSEHFRSLEYDDLINKYINIGSFPFYEEIESSSNPKNDSIEAKDHKSNFTAS